MNRKELAARLLVTFLAELEEQLRGMTADLLALESARGDPALLASLFRAAHTLKGAARAAGVKPVEEVCHALEARLARVRDQGAEIGEAEFPLFFRAVDALTAVGRRVAAGGPADDPELARLLRGFRGPPGIPAGTPAPAVAPAEVPPPGGAAERRGEARPAGGEVRVDAARLDALVAAAGELLTAAEAVAARPAELRELREAAVRWADAWRAAGPHAAPRQPAPEDHRLVLRRLDRLAAAAEEDARALGRLAEQVGHHVQQLRMAPFAEACEPLPRAVRDVARAAGKEARLQVRGADVHADREVWAAVRQALLHLVRNAVDHGIEPPDARLRAGKPPGGTVTCAAALHGDRVIVTVADDGAGLDGAALRAALERRGGPVPAGDAELVRSLFRGGISTRAEATLVSGRGVGLDSVRAAVERVRGGVDVSWKAGEGSTFRLQLPLTLTQVRAVLVRAGKEVLAFPSTDVERIVRASPAGLRRVDGRAVLAVADAPVPLLDLARLVGAAAGEARTASFPVLLTGAGGRRLGIAVDEVLAEQGLLARPVHRLRDPPRWLAGATILSSGRVALLLNPAALLEAGLEDPAAALPLEGAHAAGPPRILVVDDSITTRTLEQSILEAAGYGVVTAPDGEQGWRILQEQPCDLVVSDVEMPRMDGFALCEAIRGSRRLRELPVVLVTAREAPADRARGMEAGADAYLLKSTFDHAELLETIRQLVGPGA